nr:immunoglobulin heavy chain junction region [Macaca mulatta]MOW46002.1 immunoglobulin heavy chain junction region [Macaca mulatta]MOW48488.1 immunoglobulin heavy chain junction region [Macaca mulatta]MOW48679.1 immunoglobulin heavy chain junction region [Macaca mulatta]MOW49255.1 immunoglobulin heavy chain junction region [Macaca mulatta]
CAKGGDRFYYVYYGLDSW